MNFAMLLCYLCLLLLNFVYHPRRAASPLCLLRLFAAEIRSECSIWRPRTGGFVTFCLRMSVLEHLAYRHAAHRFAVHDNGHMLVNSVDPPLTIRAGAR